MTWTVTVAKPAQKQTARFPAKDQAKIGVAVRSMADDPFAGDVLKLEAEDNLWRRRVAATGFSSQLTTLLRLWPSPQFSAAPPKRIDETPPKGGVTSSIASMIRVNPSEATSKIAGKIRESGRSFLFYLSA
jgi:hypothetical protein